MTSIVRMTECEQRRLIDYCHERDVRKGGIFDVRSAAINVWSRPWLSDEDCQLSECVGTIWLQPNRVELEGAVPVELVGLPLPLQAKRELV